MLTIEQQLPMPADITYENATLAPEMPLPFAMSNPPIEKKQKITFATAAFELPKNPAKLSRGTKILIWCIVVIISAAAIVLGLLMLKKRRKRNADYLDAQKSINETGGFR